MSVKLKKEQLRLSEVICSRYCQTTVDCDVIVPDINPDVLKVLRVSGEAVITQKSIQTDRVFLQGIIRLDVLYIPDGNVIGNVKSISCTQDFSHTIDAPDVNSAMSLVAEVDCESVEYTLVNCRKLNLRTKLGMNIKVTALSEVLLSTGIDEASSIHTNSQHLCINTSCCEGERDIVVRERVEVPTGKPCIGEILKLSAKAQPKELRLLEGKALLKGEIKLCTLYCSEEEDGSVECMEHTLPLNELLEIDGITETMTAEADCFIKNIYGEISRDADGDKRIVNTELTVTVCIRGSETVECDVLCDAYALDSQLKLERTPCSLEQLLHITKAEVTQKETIAVPDYLPEIHQVCDCNGSVGIESIAVHDGQVTVSGYLTCDILYMCADHDTPLSGFSHILPFSHSFDVADATEKTVCDVKAEVEHLSYTISGARSLELRSVITLCLKAANPTSCQVISEISYDENAELPTLPSIIVSFAREGDTLWNIAKRYRTTTEELLEVNGAEKDFLKPGNKIYIFR